LFTQHEDQKIFSVLIDEYGSKSLSSPVVVSRDASVSAPRADVVSRVKSAVDIDGGVAGPVGATASSPTHVERYFGKRSMATPAIACQSKKVKLGDVRNGIASVIEEKRATTARRLALDEQAQAERAEEHRSRMAQIEAAASHAAEIRKFEISEKEVDLEIKKIDLEIKKAQLALLKKQIS
jgi:hypothetical protein